MTETPVQPSACDTLLEALEEMGLVVLQNNHDGWRATIKVLDNTLDFRYTAGSDSACESAVEALLQCHVEATRLIAEAHDEPEVLEVPDRDKHLQNLQQKKNRVNVRKKLDPSRLPK